MTTSVCLSPEPLLSSDVNGVGLTRLSLSDMVLEDVIEL